MGVTWDLTRGQVAWSIAGLVLTLVVAFVLYSFIGAIVVGVFLYYAIRPVDRWFAQYSDHSALNATLTLLIVGLPILLILGYGALVAIREPALHADGLPAVQRVPATVRWTRTAHGT